MPAPGLPMRIVALVERLATRERIRGYSLLLGAVLAAIGIANYAAGDGLLDAFGNVVGADFLAFYTGARLLAEDRLAAAYEPGPDFSFPAQLAFQRELLAPQRPPGVHPFINPPHAALLYLPFAKTGYVAGLALWWAAGGLALWVSARRLRAELPGLQRWSTARLWAVSFLFLPTMAWVGYAQATPFVLWLHTETFLALRRGRDAWAGAWLACLAFKPQLAIAPAVVLLACGRWRAVLTGAGVAALWLAVGVASDPMAARAYLELAPRLPAMLRAEGYPTHAVHSLLGFTALLLDPASKRLAEGVALLLSLAALGLLLHAWRRHPWRPATEGWDLRMAATFVLGLAVSPQLFVYDLMLLLLPFSLLVAWRSATPDRPPLGGGPLLVWAVALWALASFGSQLSLAQVAATEALGAAPRAVQLSALALVGASLALLRAADRPPLVSLR